MSKLKNPKHVVIDASTRDALAEYGKKSEIFNDVILRLLNSEGKINS